jgi:hypothetical protein
MTEYRLPTKSERRCQCGEIYTIGRPHTCKARAATPQAKPVTNVTNSVNNVTNKITSPLTNAAERYLKRLEADRKRAARWRVKNRERYNSYMCGLMRKRRAAKAAA